MDTLTSWVRIGVLLGVATVSLAQAATPAAQLAGYVAQAGAPAQPARGQQFFTSRHGPRVQSPALYRRGQDREMVQAQLQRRAGPCVHGRREGRRAGLAADAQALSGNPVTTETSYETT